MGVACFWHFQLSMLEEVKEHWRSFERAEPGTRFEKLHESRSESAAARTVTVVLGVLLLAGGIVLLFIPGPGLLLIAFGAGLIGRESRRLARVLDRTELLLRRLARRGRDFWKGATTPVRAAVVSAGVLIVGLAACVAWVWLARN